MNRLMLTPGLRRLWRGDREIQFGVDPARAVVIHLGDAAHARLFDLLDGTRSERGVLRDAAALGIASRDAFELLSAVREAGLVASAGTIVPDSLTTPVRGRLASEAAAIAVSRRDRDRDRSPDDRRSAVPTSAEALRRRAAAAILVTGVVRLVVPIATALAGAGIGQVDASLKGRVTAADVAPGGLGPADIGSARGTAAAAAIMRAAPETNTRRLRDGAASFVIQAGAHAPAELLAHGLARRRLPHLLLEERDESILVGPLVIPGRTPCLNCLDLHRRDSDRAWPALAAQIATAPEMAGATAVSTLLIAAGIAAAQVLGHIDGAEVETLGASVEISPPARIRRRSWGRHPGCRCIRRADSSAVPQVDPDVRGS